MVYTFAQTKAGYASLWAKAKLLPAKQALAHTAAEKIIADRAVFEEVQAATKVPWFMVGCMLFRESNLNLATYLGNGQPLSQRTTVVPKDRGPFATFQAGAIDALTLQGMTGITDWSIELILYWLERFNGQGYFSRGNSPYLWSWTDQYHAGKFTSDGHYDPNFVDPQGGCAAVLKALLAIDAGILPAPPTVQPKEPTLTDPTVTTATMPLPTTPMQAAVNWGQIESTLETILNYAPVVATVYPPARGVVPYIPVIEGVLRLGRDLQAGPHDLPTMIGIFEKHFAEIAAAVKATLPPPPAA